MDWHTRDEEQIIKQDNRYINFMERDTNKGFMLCFHPMVARPCICRPGDHPNRVFDPTAFLAGQIVDDRYITPHASVAMAF